MAHQVAPMTNNLAKKIDKRFVLPSSLSGNRKPFFPLKIIYLGFSDKQQLKKFLNDEIVSKKQYLKIFEGRQAFHRAYLQYVLEKMNCAKGV